MTNFIPIFPLDMVVYPDETIKLHIAEPRYKQLIKETLAENKPFGIPVLQQGKALEYGTLVEVVKDFPAEEDGSFYVEIKGIQVFRILEFVKDIPDKLFSGAIVNYPENDKMKVHPNLSKLIFDEVKSLYFTLNIENFMPKDEQDWTSYFLAHRLGLTKEQEYELLSIFNEVQRMEYLRRYMNSIMPDLENLDSLKSRINLN